MLIINIKLNAADYIYFVAKIGYSVGFLVQREAIMSKLSPIAVLDTGAGGLSVVNSLLDLLPHEAIYYFADTANLPYGIKSQELISRLSLAMVQKVIDLSSCKVLVIACHTISVCCLEQIRQAVKIPVIGMCEPSILGLAKVLAQKPIRSVGILSTSATKNSGVYRNAWQFLDPKDQISLIEHASTPLVYLVEEEGNLEQDLLSTVMQFVPKDIQQCDALLIGCTHFSALKPALKRILKEGCEIIDAADSVARATHDILTDLDSLAENREPGELKVYISDNKERFKAIARRFINKDLAVTLMSEHAALESLGTP